MCRCYICDTELTDTEISFSEDPKHKLDPCRKCEEIALDAAYSEGFTPDQERPLVEDAFDFWEPELPFENNNLSESS